MNTAVAMNVTGDHVGIYLGEQPVLWINGQPAPATAEPIYLWGGGQVVQDGFRYTVVWVDGARVIVTASGQYLDAIVWLPPYRQGRVEGLLGNANGVPADDLITRQEP